MKKLIVLLVVILLLGGCAQTSPEDDSTKTNLTIETTTEGIEDEPTDAETVEKYKHDIVPDFDAAAEIATAVYNYAKKPEGTENYKVAKVFHSENNDMWCVLLSDGDFDQITSAEVGSCMITINRKTGEIFNLYFRTAEEQKALNAEIGRQ